MPILLQINVTANWGSTGKIAEAIGNVAMKTGWESYIAYGRMCNPSKSKLIKIGTKVGTLIHYGYNRIGDLEGRGSRWATYRFVERIKEIKPDIVQLHNIHDHFLNYEILFEYLNSTDIPVVWTFHDSWAFTGHCYHFVFADCMKWQTECGFCPRRNIIVDRSTGNFLLKKRLFSENKNLTIAPCSKWLADFVKSSFLKDKRISVIHNGVDLNVFKPISEAKKNDGIFRILAVSNVWRPYKGLNDIFSLRQMLPNDYEIIMVGLKENQMKELPSGIKGIQRTQNVQELVTLYNEADVLINPTYADTFPTVNIEALACGTPVLTYNTGGSPEVVTSETGWVVEQGDLKSVVDIVKSMKQKGPDELSDQRKACRDRAVSVFDKDKCFADYLELYNDLLSV